MKTLDEEVSAYLERTDALGFSRRTLAERRCALGHFMRWAKEKGAADWSEVTPRMLERYFLEETGRLNGRTPPKPLSRYTLAGKFSVICGFFGHLVKENTLLDSPARDLSLGKRPTYTRRAPSREEVARLLDIQGTDRGSLRLRAMLEVLYSTGIRRAELCGLNLEDVDWARGVLWVRCGKGGKDRLVPIGEKALQALRDYLQRSRPLYKPRCRALFVAIQKTGVCKEYVGFLVRKRSQAAGIEGQLGPHHLRHAFATHLLENGASVIHVQAMLGHVRAGTTQRYTHVNAKRLRETMDRFDLREALKKDSPAEPAPGLGRLAR